MRITEVTIKFEPNEREAELNRGVRILKRDVDKFWSCGDSGLYPSEVKLANEIQELIINKYNNSGEK